MNQIRNNHYDDPMYAITGHDSADSGDLSPEGMERTHEELEDERARLLGIVPVAQHVAKLEEIDETQINYDNFVRLLQSCDTAFDIKRIFEDSIELDRKSGLLTEDQYQLLVSLRLAREQYLKYLSTETHVDDGRYGD
jgi:hypothetical protein